MIKYIHTIMIVIYYYHLFLTFFSWKKYKCPKNYNSENEHTFSILIPCHNEEEVIHDNLLSIYNSTYDKNKYKVFIIADNCSDNTIINSLEFIKSHNDFDCEIIKVNGGSKPTALNLAIQHLKDNNKWIHDNIVILDADNKISPSLLSTFNYYHNQHKILQCRIKSDNDESFIAKGFTSAFNSMSYRFQLSRNRVGLSSSLCGTGFSINRKVFDHVGFQNCDTLTEDLEFSILSILNGYKVKYVMEEYVLNQNLDTFKPSINQRIRWCRGHAQVGAKLSRKLIKQFVKTPKWQIIDSLLFINSPIISTITSLTTTWYLFNFWNFGILLRVLIVLTLFYNIIFILYSNNWKIKYILPLFHFSFFMYFIIIIGQFTYKNKKWVKTKHIKIN